MYKSGKKLLVTLFSIGLATMFTYTPVKSSEPETMPTGQAKKMRIIYSYFDARSENEDYKPTLRKIEYERIFDNGRIKETDLGVDHKIDDILTQRREGNTLITHWRSIDGRLHYVITEEQKDDKTKIIRHNENHPTGQRTIKETIQDDGSILREIDSNDDGIIDGVQTKKTANGITKIELKWENQPARFEVHEQIDERTTIKKSWTLGLENKCLIIEKRPDDSTLITDYDHNGDGKPEYTELRKTIEFDLISK